MQDDDSRAPRITLLKTSKSLKYFEHITIFKIKHEMQIYNNILSNEYLLPTIYTIIV